MNKNVNTWIEGNGTVRTVFRKLALYEYCTRERSKLQLTSAIEKEREPLNNLTVQYAIDRRKKEIQWVSLHLPLLAFVMPLILVFGAAVSTHNPAHLYATLGLMTGLAIIYRTTFYNQYLTACRQIYFAGVDLEEMARSVAGPVEDVNTEVVPAFESQANSHDQEITNAGPALVVETLEACPSMVRLQEEAAVSLTSIDKPYVAEPAIMEESPETEDPLSIALDIVEGQPLEIVTPGKGSIATFLLNELIKKECGRPNIYSGDISKTIKLFYSLSGCNEKNILAKVKFYRSRKSIEFLTTNAKSTHRKYMESLLLHHEETGDDILYKQAEDLQAYLENLAVRQKG